MSVTDPMPSHRAHIPPWYTTSRTTIRSPLPLSTVIDPLAFRVGILKEKALDEPMCGLPRRLNSTRSIALASVTVPTVERALAPIRSWSTMIAVVSPSSTSTSGRAIVGMNPCTNAL